MKLVLATFLAEDYPFLPYGCVALEAFLISKSHELLEPIQTKILSFDHNTAIEEALKQIASHKPDIVGFSCYIWNYEIMLTLIPQIKMLYPSVIIVVGGPQLSSDDQQLNKLLLNGVIDYAVAGDGEEVLWNIVSERMSNYHDDPNIAKCNKNRNVQTVKGVWLFGMVNNIDLLPNPYHLNESMLVEAKRTGVAFIEASRGCAYSCTFCDQGWRRVRTRNIDIIEQDLEFVYKHGARVVIFLDPTFNAQRQRLMRLITYIKERLPDLSISAEVKADILTESEMIALASLNKISIEVGLQSSNEMTLQRIRRPSNLTKIRENVTKLISLHVHVTINTIFGLPGETIFDWMDTLDFCYSLGSVYITSCPLKILPNTELFQTQGEFGYQYAKETPFRPIKNEHMGIDEFKIAYQMSKLLVAFEEQSQIDKKRTIEVISTKYNGSLARFLLHNVKHHNNNVFDNSTYRH